MSGFEPGSDKKKRYRMWYHRSMLADRYVAPMGCVTTHFIIRSTEPPHHDAPLPLPQTPPTIGGHALRGPRTGTAQCGTCCLAHPERGLVESGSGLTRWSLPRSGRVAGRVARLRPGRLHALMDWCTNSRAARHGQVGVTPGTGLPTDTRPPFAGRAGPDWHETSRPCTLSQLDWNWDRHIRRDLMARRPIHMDNGWPFPLSHEPNTRC